MAFSFQNLGASLKQPRTLQQLKQQNDTQTYFEECNYIWQNMVPNSGHSEFLQGELLRCVENLRWEAQVHGNLKWSAQHEQDCDFLIGILPKFAIFSYAEQKEFEEILLYLKACGTKASLWRCGKVQISEDELDQLVYTEDNLYNILADAIGQIQNQFSEPILLKNFSLNNFSNI